MCMFPCVYVCEESKLLFLWAFTVGKVTHNKPEKDSCATMTWPHSIVTTVGCHMPMQSDGNDNMHMSTNQSRASVGHHRWGRSGPPIPLPTSCCSPNNDCHQRVAKGPPSPSSLHLQQPEGVWGPNNAAYCILHVQHVRVRPSPPAGPRR